MTEFRYKDRNYLGEYDLDVDLFSKFNLEVEDVIPIRKVYIAKTNIGDVVLKKIDYSISELRFIGNVIDHLNDNGFNRVFSFVKSKENEVYVRWNDSIYCVMTHINGRECQFMNPVDLEISCKALGEFHKASRNFVCNLETRDNRGNMINGFYHKLNNLITYREMVSKYKHRNEFDNIFMENVDENISDIKKSIEILERSRYIELCKDNNACAVCHHDLAYHNILILDEQGYFIDLDYSIVDLKVHDLCNFINKVMKEFAFDINTAKNIIKNYCKYNELTKSELEVLYGLMIFPQDFYSVAQIYYERERNWEFDLFIRKITRKAGYKEERDEFLKEFKSLILK